MNHRQPVLCTPQTQTQHGTAQHMLRKNTARHSCTHNHKVLVFLEVLPEPAACCEDVAVVDTVWDLWDNTAAGIWLGCCSCLDAVKLLVLCVGAPLGPPAASSR